MRDEFVDERVVVVVADPSVAPAEILRVFEQFDVVGAHVEHDRQGAGRVDPADEGVQRELADRDAHPADALVTQPEDALPVRHDDDVDFALGTVAQHLAELGPVRIGHEQPPRPPVDLAEALAGLTDRRGVDDRHRLRDVVAQQPVEQRLVAVLQRAQVDVLVEIVTASGELVPAVFNLLLDGLLCDRQQAQQPELAALRVGEGGALGRQRVEQLVLSGLCLRQLGSFRRRSYGSLLTNSSTPTRGPVKNGVSSRVCRRASVARRSRIRSTMRCNSGASNARIHS